MGAEIELAAGYVRAIAPRERRHTDLGIAGGGLLGGILGDDE